MVVRQRLTLASPSAGHGLAYGGSGHQLYVHLASEQECCLVRDRTDESHEQAVTSCNHPSTQLIEAVRCAARI